MNSPDSRVRIYEKVKGVNIQKAVNWFALKINWLVSIGCNFGAWCVSNSLKRETKSTFTWYPKWTQTGLKSQTALKCRSVYMAIYMEISLQQLSKQYQGSIAHVQMMSFN